MAADTEKNKQQMEAAEAISKYVDEQITPLTEARSKELLKNYGVPVVEEAIALTPEEAAAVAQAFGFPVVLKGLGAKLTHKTERGLVKLNLSSTEDVKSACLDIQKSAGADLEGFLLQPQLQGRREFVAGLFQDEQFGPVVMFGLGGVFTEWQEDRFGRRFVERRGMGRCRLPKRGGSGWKHASGLFTCLLL